MKRPSFQFYPSDWLRDTALRTCSIGARGLWIDMICYMHEGSPYGYLKVNEKVILTNNLARMVGETLEVVEGWLLELSEAGVFQYADDGSIFSKRMIRDEYIRNTRAKGGVLGGNPNLLKKDKDNHKVEDKVNQNTTPSSLSSSSSSSSKTTKNIYSPEFEEFWLDYPKREGKSAAFKEWKRIAPDKELQEKITEGVLEYRKSRKVKEGFIKDCVNWLKGKHWEDEMLNVEIVQKTYESPWQKADRLRMQELAPGVATRAHDDEMKTIDEAFDSYKRPQRIQHDIAN